MAGARASRRQGDLDVPGADQTINSDDDWLVIKEPVKKATTVFCRGLLAKQESVLQRSNYFATAPKTFFNKSLPACNGLARIVRSCSPTTL